MKLSNNIHSLYLFDRRTANEKSSERGKRRQEVTMSFVNTDIEFYKLFFQVLCSL